MEDTAPKSDDPQEALNQELNKEKLPGPSIPNIADDQQLIEETNITEQINPHEIINEPLIEDDISFSIIKQEILNQALNGESDKEDEEEEEEGEEEGRAMSPSETLNGQSIEKKTGKIRGPYKALNQQLKETIVRSIQSGTSSRKELARILQIPYKTVCRVFNGFLRTGVIAESKKKGGRKKKMLTDEHIHFLKVKMNENCGLTLKELKSIVEQEYDISISQGTIANYIKGEFFFSFKREPLNLPLDESVTLDERTYCTEYLNILNSGKSIIFLDMAKFKVMTRNYYGEELKKTKGLKINPSIANVFIKVIIAMDRHRLLYFKVFRNYEEVDLSPCLDVLFPKLKSINETNCVLITDGKKLPYTDALKQKILQAGHELKYLPTNSTNFNPVEILFSDWNSVLVSKEPKDEAALKNIIDNYDYALLPAKCEEYMKTCEESVKIYLGIDGVSSQ